MCKVLIIDDEEAVRCLLTEAFSLSGIDTDAAINGQDGIEKFHQGKFDIVITDLSMPGMNGNSVARQIRNSDRPHTPIIGISGTTWLFEDSQFDLVFEKPMSIISLVGAVKNLAPADAPAAQYSL
ncbi:response regulator [Desulfosarcina sp.]|uniref:response regulator n=1 Tax=Desulfosarcina sp. TaxID=2027861 RepID=UPI0029A13A86|nr:response regulator [Desulfosarcina sp.]MDX2451563.1 response regulator [Desulfosarcina sp.]